MSWSIPLRALFGLLATVAFVTGCGGGDDSTLPPIDEEYPEAQLALGEDVYSDTCSQCHGRSGGGGIGPDLTAVADRLDFDEHLAVVTDGTGAMPAWSGTLTAEEIEAVVAYERVGLR